MARPDPPGARALRGGAGESGRLNAWRRSEPALAWAALAKAAQALPDNTMSELIGVVLTAGINPETLPWPLPEGTDLEGLLP
ncbi:hypothetical protein [Actinoplanes sp. NPDC026619]|uniref:hypothetical protein n=1 Tax=Actinoplanes sp. NPDC026619 TaxID=3155798 RepID=UPI0033F69C0F